jgi:hypothetical protein
MTQELNKQQISLRTVLKACTNENWQVARMWLYYTVFYWLLPTLITIFGLFVAKRTVNWRDLLIHGEFLIYAITLTAASTRLVAKDVPGKEPFFNRQAFNLFAQVMILPAIFTYGLVRYIGLTVDPSAVNERLVITYSVVLLVAAFAFSFLVFLMDAQRSTPNFPQQVAAEIENTGNKLGLEFDAMQVLAGEATLAPERDGNGIAELGNEVDALEEGQ